MFLFKGAVVKREFEVGNFMRSAASNMKLILIIDVQSVSREGRDYALSAIYVQSPYDEDLDWKLAATMSPCHVKVSWLYSVFLAVIVANIFWFIRLRSFTI